MTRRKDLCPLLIVYFEDRVQGFPKRILLYILNAWFGEKSKMVILGKIVKKCQLKMTLESRKPIMPPEKRYIEGFCLGLSSQ